MPPPAVGCFINFEMKQFITRDQLEDILAERLKRPVKAQKTKEDMDNG